MGKYSDFYQARQTVLDIVNQDLLGPVYSDEVINEPPTSYYIMGKLYPKTDVDMTPDENTTGTELSNIDEDSSLASANVREPRAMGVTVTVKPNVSQLRVSFKYAIYNPYSLEEAKANNLPLDRYTALVEQANEKERSRMTFWKRIPQSFDCVIPCDKSYRRRFFKRSYTKWYARPYFVIYLFRIRRFHPRMHGDFPQGNRGLPDCPAS